jgi:hypothetical protein
MWIDGAQRLRRFAKLLEKIQDLAFEALHQFHRHVEEITGTAGRIEHARVAEFVVKFFDRFARALLVAVEQLTDRLRLHDVPVVAPDRNSFRIGMARSPAVRARLKSVWEDPSSLDPTKHAAEVTQDIAAHRVLDSIELRTSRLRKNPDRSDVEIQVYYLKLASRSWFDYTVRKGKRGAARNLIRHCENGT